MKTTYRVVPCASKLCPLATVGPMVVWTASRSVSSLVYVRPLSNRQRADQSLGIKVVDQLSFNPMAVTDSKAVEAVTVSCLRLACRMQLSSINSDQFMSTF